jgi:membrane protease YdiL (CAAX protease family)
MSNLTRWIRTRPVVAFYVVCYALTWGLWLPLLLGRSMLSELLAMIGLFGGPGIACLLVARLSPPAGPAGRRLPWWLSLLGAWIVCAVAMIAYQVRTAPHFAPAALIVWAALALVPAAILAAAWSGSGGVRRTFSSLVEPPGSWWWYLAALLLPLALRLASVWVSRLLGWPLMTQPQPPANPLRLAGSAIIILLYTLIYAGGLNEESGWTGFALPRFLARWNPLLSTVILWALWMLWHVPLHYAGYFELSAHVLVGSFFGRFLMTWLFLRSRGGMWTAMLLHASVNVTSQFVPVTNASLLVDGLVAVVVIVAGRMWRRLPEDHPARFQGERS